MPNPAPDAGPTASSNTRFLKSNRGVATALFVLVAIIAANIWFSDWAHRELRDGFLLGGFPLFAVFMMAVSVLILMFDGQSRTIEPGLVYSSLTAGIVVLSAAIILGVVFLSFDYLGFVPAIALFILGGSTALGYRPIWSAAVVGIAISIVLRTIMFALGVDIDDGLIWAFISNRIG